MANFRQSNIMGNCTKTTRKRIAVCPYCSKVNASTTKSIGTFHWEMDFECGGCGKKYWKPINECIEV